MRIDFHVHGLLSKKNKFNEELLLQGIHYAKENGLNAFVLCEHFNARYIDDIQKYLEENHEYIGDCYKVEDFSVFLGMEVDIKGGGHIIVCSNREVIAGLRETLKQYLVKPNFIPFEELLRIGEEQGCLMVGSHPYRESHKLYLQPKELLSRLHALDLNATDIYDKGLEKVEEEVCMLSNELGIPYVTGSDSHYPVQLGSVRTCFEEEIHTVAELKKAIQEERYQREISDALDLKVFSAKTTKARLKELIAEQEAKAV